MTAVNLSLAIMTKRHYLPATVVTELELNSVENPPPDTIEEVKRKELLTKKNS
jgi:hypothetical protein